MQQETTQTPLEAVFNFHMFTPKDVKQQYYELADKVASSKGISPEEAVSLIRSAEKDNKFSFYGMHYGGDGFRHKLYLRRELEAKSAIGLVTPEEQEELDQLRLEFQESVQRVQEATQLEESAVVVLLEDAMLFIVTENINQLESILTTGPIIEGFTESQDYQLTDETVRSFLQTAFGIEELRGSKVGRVKKDDEYMLIIPSNASDSFKDMLQEMISEGLIRRSTAANMVIAETKDAYEQVELKLEGKTEPTDLDHTYKIRASSGHTMGFSEIDFHSFAVERPDQFDYLESLPLTDDEKMRAYILGTIAHEVAHRWESSLGEDGKDMRDQVSGFIAPQNGESRYVSGYVSKHAKIYGTDQYVLMQEDFAESIRIFMTNPDYLQTHFPDRFGLVQQHLPFLKPGIILDFVKVESEPAN